MRIKAFFIKSLLLLLTGLTVVSCKTVQNIAYFDDLKPGEAYPVNEKPEIVVHNNDRLSIVVSCKEPDLAKVFNIHEVAVAAASDGAVKDSGKGYKVDKNGDITFPLLGKLHLAGLTLQQVSELVRSKIIENEYIKDPIVETDILNFKYTVLGSTGPGVYTSDDGEVTLLDAIAKAGDIREIGRLDKIAVVREVDGKREVYYHDIRSKDIFNSPCFYLQQNDVVYVEPKYRQRTKGERTFSIMTMAVSFVTTIASLIYLMK